MIPRYVLVLVPDLFFAARIAETARSAGVAIENSAPAAALERCRAAPPSLVILDLHASGDPLTAVRALRSDPATRDIPVVGFHSHVDTALRERALAAGVDPVLPRSAFTARLASLLTGDVPGRAPQAEDEARLVTSATPAPTPAPAPLVRVSEVFLSIQGEGPSAGTPAHFIRLQGCDVGCVWCDSKYTWAPGGGGEMSLDALWERARALGEAPLVVVTGGEPLEHEGIARVLAGALERWPRVEVETSGVLPPPLRDARLAWNVSPKLPRVTPRWRETWVHTAAFLADPNATFKIVVGDPPDLDDALAAIASHALPPARVMLMPEGLTDEAVRNHAIGLAEVCKRQGFRLSPRLHVWMWGAKRGV